MHTDKMIREANRIAKYFEVYPQDRAQEGVTGHIRSFWEPRMRRQLVDYVHEGGAELHPLVVGAANALEAEGSVPAAAAQTH